MLHPQLADMVAHADSHAQVSMTTNGFLHSDRLIERLNDAGLSNMQISIDTVYPETSGCIQKSLQSLAPKLERLQRLAQFDVHGQSCWRRTPRLVARAKNATPI